MSDPADNPPPERNRPDGPRPRDVPTDEDAATPEEVANDHGMSHYEQRGEGEPEVQQIHAPIYREKAEPRDGFEPISMVFLFIAFGLLLWGGWYLGTYSGGFHGRVYDTTQPAIALHVEEQVELEAPEDALALGRRIYGNCRPCHQPDGQGIAGQFPPLAGSRWVLGPPEVPVRIVLHGVAGPIEVRGEEYNDVMPGWGHLNDEAVAAVVTYIRNTWGNQAPPVPPELVAEVRAQTRGRRQPWSAAELRADMETRRQGEEE